jgi:hypothetical protein
VLENHSRRVGKLHPALQTRVELRPHLLALWSAYVDLNAERAEGGAIPGTAIEAWARIWGWSDPESLRYLYRVVRALDGVYNDPARRPTPESPPTPVSRPRRGAARG